jgi:hypothetical protein
VAGVLAEIKRMPEGDARYPKLVQEFDTGCGNLFARFGSIQAEKVDSAARFSASPVRKEPSTFDLHLLDPMPESISTSDMLDLPMRSLSFSQQLDGTDLGKRETAESITPSQVWQTRPYADTNLVYFETAALNPTVAALVYVPFGGTHRSLSVNRYAGATRQKDPWTTHQLPVHGPVESMAIGQNMVFMLTNERIFKTSLDRDAKTDSAPLPPTASGRFVTPFMDGAVAGFHSSPQLLYTGPQFAMRTIPTPFRGIMCVAPMQELLVCGVLGSGVIRLLTVHGHECRSFVGHCAPVMRVTRLGPNTFASSGDDATVRVWDVRDRFPVVSVTSNGVSVVNIAGSEEVIISALHNKTVNVFDLRNAGRPLLAVPTQDYEAANLHYSQQADTLAMFGIVEKEASKDSMMFVDNDGQSRQRIFRVYEQFLAPP